MLLTIHIMKFYNRGERLKVIAVIQIGFTYAIWQCVCIFSVLLYIYGCETWTLTLRGERKLRVFMVTPCINNIKYFIVQLMHSILQIVGY